MSALDLPSLNAMLNLTSLVFLVNGFVYIKQKNKRAHKIMMISAVVISALFFISYMVYHSQVGSVPYPHYDWTRPVYFIILVPHIILAALMAPFILAGLMFAAKQKFESHRRMMRWVWPVWVYVSLSGVLVYVMLYRL